MTGLRKVSTSEEEYQDLKNKYFTIHKSFRNFAQLLTDKAGRATKSSNKSDSYANTLIKLTVLYKENFNEIIPPDELRTFKGLSKLERVKQIEGFKEFNTAGSRFMSATISCFRAYITSEYDKIEAKMDSKLNDKLVTQKTYDLDSPRQAQPKSRPDKQISGNKLTYPRSISEALLAKQNSNWTCELDESHTTFISAIDGNNFVEAHHLIPMSAQDNYSNSLDFADNIITLCPNCHRLIHHADISTRNDAIDKLFDKRKHLYPSHGITIKRRILKNYYGII